MPLGDATLAARDASVTHRKIAVSEGAACLRAPGPGHGADHVAAGREQRAMPPGDVRRRTRDVRRLTPLAALGRGLAAGLAGTAAMTAYQAAVAIRRGSTAKDAVAPEPPDTWSEAPAPAQVGYRFL